MFIGQPVLTKKDGIVKECKVIDMGRDDIILEDPDTKEHFIRFYWEVQKVK